MTKRVLTISILDLANSLCGRAKPNEIKNKLSDSFVLTDVYIDKKEALPEERRIIFVWSDGLDHEQYNPWKP